MAVKHDKPLVMNNAEWNLKAHADICYCGHEVCENRRKNASSEKESLSGHKPRDTSVGEEL